MSERNQDGRKVWKLRKRLALRNKILISLAGMFMLCVVAWLLPEFKGPGNAITIPGVLWTMSFYALVALYAGWLFFCLAPIVRNRVVNAVCMIVLFVFGCTIYYFAPVDRANDDDLASKDTIVHMVRHEQGIEAPNRTIASFFPSRGGFENIPRSEMRLLYFLFHSLAIFYIVMMSFAVFGRGLVNRVWKWVVRQDRLNVFWGRSEAAVLLARNILETTDREQVFFCLPVVHGDGDARKSLTRDLDRMDAIWAFSDDIDEVRVNASVEGFGIAKGLNHFFLDESVHENLKRAQRLVRLLRDNQPERTVRGFGQAIRAGVLGSWWKAIRARDKEGRLVAKPRWNPPYFYVRVNTLEEERAYEVWAANVKDWVYPVLLREASLIAKDFVHRYPVLDLLGADESTACVSSGCRVLIIGFGACGQAVLSEYVRNGQFLCENGETASLCLDVIEKDSRVVEEFCQLCPDIQTRFMVHFETDVRVESVEFDGWMRNHLTGRDKYDRIIVCLKGDEMNQDVAGRILEIARRNDVPIDPKLLFAKISDPCRTNELPKSMRTLYSRAGDGKAPPMITFFGNLETVYSIATIDARRVDRAAILLNSRHGDAGAEVFDGKKAARAWQDASYFDWLSSRAAAEGQRNLLRLIGYGAIPADDVNQSDSLAGDEFDKRVKQVLDTLARNEHLRWNAFHFMRGYRVWDVLGADRPEINGERMKKIRANQLNDWGRHADLVPYDRLPDVDAKLANWKQPESTVSRDDFVGREKNGAQAYDIAFCELMRTIAENAGFKIVKIRSQS